MKRKLKINLKRWTILFSVLFSISGCSFSPHSEQTTSFEISTLDNETESLISSSSIDDEFFVKQVNSVEPLNILEGISISMEELVENNHIHNECLYFQIINSQYSWIYPTLRQYRYNFNSNQISLIKERNIEETERVWDFVEDNDTLFESVLSFQDDELYGSVYANNELIWSERLPDATYGPIFTIENGKIYVSTTFYQDDELVNALFEWNAQGSLQCIWNSLQPDSGSLLSRANTQDDYSPLVFEAQSPSGNQVYFLKDGQLQRVAWENEAIRFQSLKDNIVLFSRDENFQEMNYHLLNVLSQEITPLFSQNETIGLLNTGGGTTNSFLFVNSNNGTSLGLLDTNEIMIQNIEDLPSGISYYWTLNERENLVFIDSYEQEDNQIIWNPNYFLVYFS